MSLVAVRHLKYLWLGLNGKNDKCGFLKEKVSGFSFQHWKDRIQYFGIEQELFFCVPGWKEEWMKREWQAQTLDPSVSLLRWKKEQLLWRRGKLQVYQIANNTKDYFLMTDSKANLPMFSGNIMF